MTKSPFECLFSIQPNYTMLKNFGCLFYPYFKTYTSHKLDSRSIPGTFLRYNLRHKGNKCISSDSWLYISSNVIFVEDQFPFAQKLFDKSPLVSQPIHTILPMCYRSKLVSLLAFIEPLKFDHNTLPSLSHSTSHNTPVSSMPISSLISLSLNISLHPLTFNTPNNLFPNSSPP